MLLIIEEEVVETLRACICFVFIIVIICCRRWLNIIYRYRLGHAVDARYI